MTSLLRKCWRAFFLADPACTPTCVLGLVALLWLPFSTQYPFGWDQGVFAWAGDAINRGDMPYRDVWEVKGPAAYYGYALAERLFGHNLWGIRLFDGVLLILGSWRMFAMVSSFAGRVFGLWASLFLAVWYAAGSYWHTAQPDAWAAIAILSAVSILSVAGRERTVLRHGMAGLLIGIAVLIKPLFGVFLAVPMLMAWDNASAASSATKISAILAGFFAPMFAVMIYFSASGAAGEFVEQYLVYTSVIYSSSARSSPFSVVKNAITNLPRASIFLPVALLGLGGLREIYGGSRRQAIILGTWLLLALICVGAQNRFYAYHWIPVYAPLIALAVSFLGSLRIPRPNRRVQSLKWALLFFATAAACAPPAWEMIRWVGFVEGVVGRDVYNAAFGNQQWEVEAAAYIRSHSNDSDRVGIWGFNTTALYLSGRKNATRFGNSTALLVGETTPLRARYRAEYLKALRDVRPVYMIVGPQPEGVLRRQYSSADFPDVDDFLGRHCRIDMTFGPIKLFRCFGGGG